MHKISGLVKKHAKRFSSDSDAPGSGPAHLPIEHIENFPSKQDIFRYRKQRGVNLGSWFVLEKWITGSPFEGVDGSSDLQMARGPHAREILKKHWDGFITEQDFEYIASRGINTVRIPVGFYHLCGADSSVLDGTDFSDLGHVYQGAWTRITNAIALAAKYDLGVLLDLHAAPGKQNNDAHAGASGPAQFLKHKKNMKNTTNILKILLQQVSSFARSHSLDNVVGIELINEPASDGQHEALEAWYVDTIRELRTIDATIPLVIGDSWWTDHYAEFIHKAGLPGVILDHHLYRCFTEGDGKKGAAQHAHELTDPQNGAVKGLGAAADKLAESGGALIVGEWSAALNPGSLPGGGPQVELKRQYVDAELALFERVCAGWFYWTYKKEGGKDTGWCWRDAVEEGVFTSNFGMKASSTANVRDDQARAGRRDQVGQKALGDHSSWWDKQSGKYEHWRFADGFTSGWEDAYTVFTSSPARRNIPVPEIGFKGPWAKTRAAQHAQAKGSSNLWEFEHGFRQGVDAARADFAQNYC